MKEGIYLGKMQLKFGNWIYPRLAMTMYWWCGIKTGLVISIDDVITQVLPQIIELWGLNTQTDVQAKKNFARLTGK